MLQMKYKVEFPSNTAIENLKFCHKFNIIISLCFKLINIEEAIFYKN